MTKRRQQTFESLAECLAEWKRSGKTQEEFAEKLGISGGHLSDLKNGRAFPSRALLKKLRDDHRIPIESFLGDGVSQ